MPTPPPESPVSAPSAGTVPGGPVANPNRTGGGAGQGGRHGAARLTELDALRGIAAAMVVLFHYST
ncbi:MAG: hypothetical protein ACKOUM_03020, partial [Sphingopyxis sp.]